MGLSSEHQRKITAHLESKMRSGCPLCGARNFSIEDDVQFLGVLDPEYKQPVEGKVYPRVSVICNNCYYTFQLAAKPLGLF